MDVDERGGQVDRKAQETGRISRQLAVALEDAVERLTARVGENKDCPSFVTRERQRPGRPLGLKLGCQRVFVLKASQTLGQWLFRGGSNYQDGRRIAVLSGAVKREFRAIADWLQDVLRRCCHWSPVPIRT